MPTMHTNTPVITGELSPIANLYSHNDICTTSLAARDLARGYKKGLPSIDVDVDSDRDRSRYSERDNRERHSV
jgi:hypothetical protein